MGKRSNLVVVLSSDDDEESQIINRNCFSSNSKLNRRNCNSNSKPGTSSARRRGSTAITAARKKLRVSDSLSSSADLFATFDEPVDCIHLTSAAQLSLLEDEMRRVERVNEQARVRMSKQKGSGDSDTHWSDLWGNKKDYQNTEEETKERARRAAAAARRWREYSRKGADKPPTYKLPEAVEVTSKE